MLKIKCQECGKITEKPFEFEKFFAVRPDTTQVYDGYCSKECEYKAMSKTTNGAEEAEKDLTTECNTDGSTWK